MVFRSQKRPINSIKKVIDISGALTPGQVSVNPIADAVASAWDDAGDALVPTGCTISSIYFSVFIYSDESTLALPPLLDWYFVKNPGNNLTLPTPGATGGTDNRRWIMHEEKGLAPDVADGGVPMVFKGVLKIPRGRQRMGQDDRLALIVTSANYDAFFCIKAIYKFYR